VEEPGERDGEEDERNHPEEGPQKHEAGSPTLTGVGEEGSAEAQRTQPEGHVACHHPPVRSGRTTDEREVGPGPPRPDHGGCVDKGWHQVDGDQLPAAPCDPANDCCDGIATPPLPDRPREDQEEVEEARGQEEQGNRPGVQHQGVHPGVRCWSQTADQEEQKQAAHGGEDSGCW